MKRSAMVILSLVGGRRGQCIIMYLRICMCTNTSILMFNARWTSRVHVSVLSPLMLEVVEVKAANKWRTHTELALNSVRRRRVLIRNTSEIDQKPK